MRVRPYRPEEAGILAAQKPSVAGMAELREMLVTARNRVAANITIP